MTHKHWCVCESQSTLDVLLTEMLTEYRLRCLSSVNQDIDQVLIEGGSKVLMDS